MSTWIDQAGRRHVSVCVSRQRLHRILPAGASARDAKRIEASLRLALGRKLPSVPGDALLVDVMALYVAHARNLRSPGTALHHAYRIGQWLVGKRVSDLRQVGAEFIADATGKYAPATINRSLGTLKKALRLAWQRGMIDADPSGLLETVHDNHHRAVFLSVDEVARIAEQASPNVRAAIWIALLTGCRRGEVCKIDRADMGADTLTIQAGNTKTLRRRVVPIVAALRPWLVYLPLQINFEGVKSGFRRAREKAGMPHVHFHDLRHSCATILLAAGVDLHTIGKILGHTTPRMTDRYAHMQTEQQRAALERAFAEIYTEFTQATLQQHPKTAASA